MNNLVKDTTLFAVDANAGEIWSQRPDCQLYIALKQK